MNMKTYSRMINTVNSSKPLKYSVTICDSVLTKIAYAVYPVMIFCLAVTGNIDIVRAVAVPGISFVILSVFRYLFNAPRPYEVFGMQPVIKKDTKGKSMPSRHVFSIFVIAVTVFYFCPAAGICLGAAGVIMAAARVIGGVHFPADVAVGAAAGIASGIAGFWLI